MDAHLAFWIYYSSVTLSSGNFSTLTGDLYKDPKLFITLFHEDNAINTNPWYLHCEVLYTFISLQSIT